MKALTLWQPWASLVALGVKTIETRSWSTTYRGPLAIHAAKRSPVAPPMLKTWVGSYCLGRWADDVRHVDPCDCDEDNERTGDRCMANSEWSHALFADEGAHGFSLATKVPLGVIVATCNLVDVVPMVEDAGTPGDGTSQYDPEPCLLLSGLSGHMWLAPGAHDVEDQRPYGDFRPGRFAWLLEDIVALDEPVPAKGRQGLWEWAA